MSNSKAKRFHILIGSSILRSNMRLTLHLCLKSQNVLLQKLFSAKDVYSMIANRDSTDDNKIQGI